MTFEQVVTVVALILGPVFGVLITLYAQHRVNIGNQRLWVFQMRKALRRLRNRPMRS
jgi:hypothetical protein